MKIVVNLTTHLFFSQGHLKSQSTNCCCFSIRSQDAQRVERLNRFYANCCPGRCHIIAHVVCWGRRTDPVWTLRDACSYVHQHVRRWLRRRLWHCVRRQRRRGIIVACDGSTRQIDIATAPTTHTCSTSRSFTAPCRSSCDTSCALKLRVSGSCNIDQSLDGAIFHL